MLFFQPLFLTIVLAITPINGKPLLSGPDIETRSNHDARERLAKTHLKSRAAEAVKDLKNFQLQNIYTNTFAGVAGDSLNRTVSFSWMDPNSNSSSTICTTQWLDSTSVNYTTGVESGSNNYPSSYIFCDNSNPSFENWQWYFSRMTSLGSFQLTLAHEFTDPDVGPPPYDSLQVFARYNASLTCTTKGGFEGCYLPTAQSPATAVIYGFSA